MTEKFQWNMIFLELPMIFPLLFKVPVFPLHQMNQIFLSPYDVFLSLSLILEYTTVSGGVVVGAEQEVEVEVGVEAGVRQGDHPRRPLPLHLVSPTHNPNFSFQEDFHLLHCLLFLLLITRTAIL